MIRIAIVLVILFGIGVFAVHVGVLKVTTNQRACANWASGELEFSSRFLGVISVSVCKLPKN